MPMEVQNIPPEVRQEIVERCAVLSESLFRVMDLAHEFGGQHIAVTLCRPNDVRRELKVILTEESVDFVSVHSSSKDEPDADTASPQSCPAAKSPSDGEIEG